MRALAILILALPAAASAAPRFTLALDGGFDQRPGLRLAEPGPDDQEDPSAVGRLMLGGLVPLLSGSAGSLDLRPSGELLGTAGEHWLAIARAEAVLDAATPGERPGLQLSLGGRAVKIAPEADASFLRGAADTRAVAGFGPVELGLLGYARTRDYAGHSSWDFRSLAAGPVGRVGDEELSVQLSYLLQANWGAGGVEDDGDLEAGGAQQIAALAVGFSPDPALELHGSYTLRLASERSGDDGENSNERALPRGPFAEPPAFGPGGEPDEDADEVSAGGFVRHGVSFDATWLATDRLSFTAVAEVGRKFYKELVGTTFAPRQDTIFGTGAVGRFSLTPDLALTLSTALRGDLSNDPAHTFHAASGTAGVELRF